MPKQSTLRVLTGITTTGSLHLGNYVGAIRPAIAASRENGTESFFFMADLHSLIKCDDPARISRSRLEIAATWLAVGLDIERVVFYRQSDIPEISELAWLLTCTTSKGQMNRAHAYKAATDANDAAGVDADAGISMGLYSYPILMAADILIFNAHKVPVGRDQIQHIEMARDVAQRFNHLFGGDKEFFVLPEAIVDRDAALLPGLDGRKMSKSYDNTIPLFEGGTFALKTAIDRIETDSKLPGEPKDSTNQALVTIFDTFANSKQRLEFRSDLRQGLSWSEAKRRLFDLIESEIGPMRNHYEELMAHPERIEEMLMVGATKARSIASPLMSSLREAVGLRSFSAPLTTNRVASMPRAKSVFPVFKQYRGTDGKFYFKLIAANGRILLESLGFSEPKEGGKWIVKLQREGINALDPALLRIPEGISHGALAEALEVFRSVD